MYHHPKIEEHKSEILQNQCDYLAAKCADHTIRPPGTLNHHPRSQQCYNKTQCINNFLQTHTHTLFFYFSMMIQYTITTCSICYSLEFSLTNFIYVYICILIYILTSRYILIRDLDFNSKR